MEGIPREDNLDSLKQKLLSAEMDPRRFVDVVRELDQSTKDRWHAVRAIELLSQQDVVNFFKATDQETRAHFYNTRSLLNFHKAQFALGEGGVDAQENLQAALTDSLEAGPAFKDWSTYVEATIAYVSGNVQRLKELEPQLTENRAIVRSYISGLEKRGFPDYIHDYLIERDV